jgi:DtxR family Mn-dependent transcriptional regulator
MAADHATDAEEEYLQIIFWLEEAGLPITGANIARAMQLSPPTVHEMIGRLERDGYVTRAEDKSVSFTDDGRDHAEAIVRRHRRPGPRCPKRWCCPATDTAAKRFRARAAALR